jgi:hypothetical protein
LARFGLHSPYGVCKGILTNPIIFQGFSAVELTIYIKCIVGIWIPIWQFAARDKSSSKKDPSEKQKKPRRQQSKEEKGNRWNRAWLAAVVLGSAMVARGEIGLLIIEIGHNETPYVSDDGFITGVWAILLNTVIGPVTVGLLVKFYGGKIEEGDWGLQGLSTSASSHETSGETV